MVSEFEVLLSKWYVTPNAIMFILLSHTSIQFRKVRLSAICVMLLLSGGPFKVIHMERANSKKQKQKINTAFYF